MARDLKVDRMSENVRKILVLLLIIAFILSMVVTGLLALLK
jgi:hypothetical protein